MKKLFFIAAIASAALVSCTKNEVSQVADQHEITFETPIIGAATKVDLLTEYDQNTHFGVFGLYYSEDWTEYADGILYMNNVEVERVAPAGGDTDGGWTASGYYWPKNPTSTLTFAAYSPYMSSGVSHDEEGIHFSDYVVETGNVDLLFSDRTYNQKEANQTVNNTVYYGIDITFNHALSAILFQAKAADGLTGNDDGTPNYEFVITEIKILNANSKGTFNQGLDDDETNPATPAASADDWDTSVPNDYLANTAPITVDSTTPVSEFGDNNTGKANLILLPQSLDNVKVQVTYNLRHDGMAENEYIEGNVAEANLSYDDTEDDSNDVTSWLRGKRYIYTLTLGLDEIYFAPNISDWSDVTIPGDTIL